MLNYLVYRNTFKVTATTTRTFENLLSPSASSGDPRFKIFCHDGENTNQVVKKFTDSSENAEHNTERPGLSRSSNDHSYSSRLLGE